MDDRLHLLGIRHHGPGSAALLREALDKLDPAAVLIEGSPEADSLIPYAGLPGMKPPVALLSYVVDQPRLAVFSPFAEFSPEWQAIRWALAKGRPVRFIDWPVSVSLGLWSQAIAETNAKQATETEDVPEAASTGSDPEQPSSEQTTPKYDASDPLDLLAEAAGYPDGETFWNALIEQQAGRQQDPLAVFAAIESALTAARAWQEASQFLSPQRTQREIWREAHMRLNLRQALKEHEGSIAAVVGAWHLGGLRAETSLAADKALIKNLPKAKTATLWVPWTNSRLTMASGYGAGVLSPGWYQHLWSLYRQPEGFGIEDFVARWQSKTAAILRQAGYAASTASALEAARLTLSLAALRDLATPGLPEMREAALAVLCQGNDAPLAVIEEKLYVGNELGSLDPAIPQTPLASDLETWQRKTHLKPKSEAEEISLDLRSETGLLKSTLLHRLALLGLNWGRLIDAEAGRGTFREIWRLEWQPEFAVTLSESLVYGVTIEQAAAGKAREQAQKTSAICGLAELVRATLIADLPETANYAIACLQHRALDSSDMSSLMQAVPPLVQLLRYGTARKLPEAELEALIHALVVEINAGMRLAAYQLDEAAAAERAKAMIEYHQALMLHGTAELCDEWFRQVALLVHDELAAPALAGTGLRCLHDNGRWDPETVGQAFSWHLNGQAPAHAGAFLEAFIGNNAEVLIHDRFLLRMIDAWLQNLGEEDFLQAIPLLRRSFSSFDAMARRRLFQALSEGTAAFSSDAVAADQDNPAFAAALPLLYRILGVKQ
jgi:hypothetical protein